MHTPITHFRKNWKHIAAQHAYDFHINHGLHYGSSVFEGIRFYETADWPKIFRATDHYERLHYSARTIWLDLTYSIDQLKNATHDLIKISWMISWYIRPIIYSQAPHIALWMPERSSDIVISLRPMWKYMDSETLGVKIVHTKRIDPPTTNAHAKIGGHYVNSLLAIREIQWTTYDEALLCDTNWYIAEWPWENIFFIKDNTLYTPQITHILPGITRKTIIELAKNELHMDCKEINIHPSQLSTFEEAFFVGTAAEILPIHAITDASWSHTSHYTPTISNILQKLYMDTVQGRLKRYEHWLE